MNYDELNRFTGSLSYSILRFIISAMVHRGDPWHNTPLNTATIHIAS